jgi:hypothetical protein
MLLRFCITISKIGPLSKSRANPNTMVVVADLCRRYFPYRKHHPRLQKSEMCGTCDLWSFSQHAAQRHRKGRMNYRFLCSAQDGNFQWFFCVVATSRSFKACERPGSEHARKGQNDGFPGQNPVP